MSNANNRPDPNQNQNPEPQAVPWNRSDYDTMIQFVPPWDDRTQGEYLIVKKPVEENALGMTDIVNVAEYR